MLRSITACRVILFFATLAFAADYENVKLMSCDKFGDKMEIETSSGPRTLRIPDSVVIYGENGNRMSPATGKRFLAMAKTVTVRTEPDPNDASKEVAIEIRLNPKQTGSKPGVPAKPTGKPPGERAKLPPVEKMDLRPNPNYQGDIPDVAVPPPYMKWFPTAKLGDFVESKVAERSYAR